MSVDPLASKMPAWSPYNYALNDPLSLVDPDGRSPIKGLKVVANVGKRLYKATRRGESLTDINTWKKAGVDEVMDVVENVRSLADGQLTSDDAFAIIDLVTGFGGEARSAARTLGLADDAATASKRSDFITSPGGVTASTNPSRVQNSLENAGLPSSPTGSPGTQYVLPDGRSVRVMEPNVNRGKRISLENKPDGQPVDLDGKTPQPPKGMSKSERRGFVRDRTHIENHDNKKP